MDGRVEVSILFTKASKDILSSLELQEGDPDSRCSDETLRSIARDLKTFIRSIGSKQQKHTEVLSIDEYFQRKKSEGSASINAVIRRLKNQIIEVCFLDAPSPYHNWKDALLDISYQPISRTFLEKKRVYPSVQNPISFSDDARFKISRKKNVCTISGSSFATDNLDRLAESKDKEGNLKEAAVLDGSYTASASDGWVMAVADGCGHRDAEDENEDIGRTSYFAAKNACRLMAGYTDATALSNDLTELKNRVSQELPIKVRAHRNQPLKPTKGGDLEKTTLACVRAFHSNDGNFRLVGLNIGDSMLIAYDPTQKTFRTIAKARQILRGFGRGSPAALPDLCKDNEMDTFDVTLPEGAIVFGLTDGVWDYLPTIQNSEDDQQRLQSIDTEIDFGTLMADPNFKVPKKITVSTLTKALADYSVNRTEEERLSRLTKAGKAKLKESSVREELEQLAKDGKNIHDTDVKNKCAQVGDAMKAQKVSVGDDYTLVGMLLSSNIDPTPEYTSGEVALSVLTLGLYALIKDCLHIGTDDEVTLGDGFGAAAAIFGFFATGSLLGLGYLAYKGIRELPSSTEERAESPKKPLEI